MIEPGDIRWFRFRSPDKRRPVLVLGRHDCVGAFSSLPVIPISSQIRGLSWEVVLRPGVDGVPELCTLKPEWIANVVRLPFDLTWDALRSVTFDSLWMLGGSVLAGVDSPLSTSDACRPSNALFCSFAASS